MRKFWDKADKYIWTSDKAVSESPAKLKIMEIIFLDSGPHILGGFARSCVLESYFGRLGTRVVIPKITMTIWTENRV